MDSWQITSFLTVDADGRAQYSSAYNGVVLTVQNALDLSDRVWDALHLEVISESGVLAGSENHARVYAGTISGGRSVVSTRTGAAVIVTLAREE